MTDDHVVTYPANPLPMHVSLLPYHLSCTFCSTHTQGQSQQDRLSSQDHGRRQRQAAVRLADEQQALGARVAQTEDGDAQPSCHSNQGGQQERPLLHTHLCLRDGLRCIPVSGRHCGWQACTPLAHTRRSMAVKLPLRLPICLSCPLVLREHAVCCSHATQHQWNAELVMVGS